MKVMFTLLLAGFFVPADKLVMFDFNLKEQPIITNSFDEELFLRGKFFVHYTDIPAIRRAVDSAAKQIYKGVACEEAVYFEAGHSSLRLKSSCEQGLAFSVLLTTRMGEEKYTFTLLDEMDRRKAQMRLVDFAFYLTQAKEE